MVDAVSIASFASGLKAAGDIAKSLLGLKISGEVQAKVIELQSVIFSAQTDALSAQAAQFELIEKVRSLEEELARIKSMGSERERYTLKDVDRGAFAYVIKPEMYAGEDPHWLCVPCFDAGYKSVLQNQGPGKSNQFVNYGCPRCNSTISVHWRAKPRPPGAEPEPPEPTPGTGIASLRLKRS